MSDQKKRLSACLARMWEGEKRDFTRGKAEKLMGLCLGVPREGEIVHKK